MDTEVSSQIGAIHYERTGSITAYRNGFHGSRNADSETGCTGGNDEGLLGQGHVVAP